MRVGARAVQQASKDTTGNAQCCIPTWGNSPVGTHSRAQHLPALRAQAMSTVASTGGPTQVPGDPGCPHTAILGGGAPCVPVGPTDSRAEGPNTTTGASARKAAPPSLHANLPTQARQTHDNLTAPRHTHTDPRRGIPSIYLCPGAFPGTPPPPRSLRRCSSTFFLAAEESPTSEGLQTKRFWSLAEEKLAGFQCSWQTLGGLHFSVCRREQRSVCLHRLLAPPPRRPPPAHRHYRREWALEGVRVPGRSECKCYVMHYQM